MLTTRRLLKGLIQTTDFFKERFKKKNNNGKKICSRFSNHPSCFVMLVFETLFVSTFYPMPCSFSKTPVEKKTKVLPHNMDVSENRGFSPQIIHSKKGFSIINDPSKRSSFSKKSCHHQTGITLGIPGNLEDELRRGRNETKPNRSPWRYGNHVSYKSWDDPPSTM